MENFKLDIYKDGLTFSKEYVNEPFLMGSADTEFAKTTKICGDESAFEFLDKYCVPPLGAESINTMFSKYGKTIGGIGDDYFWNKDKLKDITEVEFWKMVALTNIYWCKKYKEWYIDQKGLKD